MPTNPNGAWNPLAPAPKDPFALTPAEHAALILAPKRQPESAPPEKQWWNFPAKRKVADEIFHEEGDRFRGQSNNLADATRHANASRRLTEQVGPIFAQGAGIAHEADNLVHAALNNVKKAINPALIEAGTSVPTPRQAISETMMDLRNNAEGRREARAGTGLNILRLQARPGGPAPRSAPYQTPPPPRGR